MRGGIAPPSLNILHTAVADGSCTPAAGRTEDTRGHEGFGVSGHRSRVPGESKPTRHDKLAMNPLGRQDRQ